MFFLYVCMNDKERQTCLFMYVEKEKKNDVCTYLFVRILWRKKTRDEKKKKDD